MCRTRRSDAPGSRPDRCSRPIGRREASCSTRKPNSTGVPPEAWTYQLGNRSALDWVLDQHKERTPKDPTIRARLNTYRFTDHKERVIDLLRRVTRVSVETVAITQAMRAVSRIGADKGGNGQRRTRRQPAPV
jgi:hypothetical protein